MPRGRPRAQRNVMLDAPRRDDLEARQRRSEILAIGARQFAEHGFEATTIRHISDAAGILPGSLYHHFANKEEMLDELIRPFVRQLIGEYEKMARLPDPADIIVATMIRFSLEQISRSPDVHTIVFNDRRYFRRTPQFGYVSALGSEISHAWYGAIQQGIREGVFRPDINIRITTSVILKIISATADWYDPASPDSIEAMVDAQQRLILGGLKFRG